MNIAFKTFDILHLRRCCQAYSERHRQVNNLHVATCLIVQEAYEDIRHGDIKNDTIRLISVTYDEWATLRTILAETMKENQRGELGFHNPALVALQDLLASYELAACVEDILTVAN